MTMVSMQRSPGANGVSWAALAQGISKAGRRRNLSLAVARRSPGVIGTEFQDIAGLALQLPANSSGRGEPDGFGLTRLQDGEVRDRDAHHLRQLVLLHLLLERLPADFKELGCPC